MNDLKGDLISRQAAIRWVKTECNPYGNPTLDFESGKKFIEHLEQMPSAQPDGDLITEDEYAEMKQTFLRMASYIDSLLICSDEQKETLMNFISQLAEYMPWRQDD